MKKPFKIMLIAGLALLLAGVLLYGVALAIEGWDITALSDTNIETLIYTEPVGSSYDRVELYFANAEIDVQFSDAVDELRIEYPRMTDRKGRDKNKVTLTETENGVTVLEELIWYRNLISLFGYADPHVTVYLPRDRVYSLNLFTDNGTITVYTNDEKDEEGNVITTGQVAQTSYLNLSSDNGDIWFLDSSYLACTGYFGVHTNNGNVQLGTLKAETLYVETDNGEITLQSAAVTGEITLLSDNGSMRLEQDLSAQKITANTRNGKILAGGRIRATEASFETDNGKIELIGGGVDAKILMLSSDNGDIRAHVMGVRSEYVIDCKVENGESNVSNQGAKDPSISPVRNLYVKNGNGDVEIQFLGYPVEPR